MNSSLPISAFDKPARDQAEHVHLARGQRLHRLRRRLLVDTGELRDHPTGDRGRQEGVAAGDRAHGGDQLLGRVVLEDEPAGAGLQRPVDVLVEVEGRQDQDPAGRVGGEDAPGRLEPVQLGHPDVHQDDVGADASGLGDGLETVAGLGHDLDVGLVGEQQAEARPHHRLVVHHQDPDRHAPVLSGSRAAGTRGARSRPGGGERRHLPAVCLDPLADADQSVAQPVVLREAARTVVAHLEPHLAGRVLDGHVGPARTGVLEGVGESLLDDAVRGEVDGARKWGRLAVHVESYVEPRGAHVSRQGRQVVQPGTWRELEQVVAVPQRTQQPAHLRECRAARLLDVSQRLPLLGRVRHPVAHGPDLEDHHAHRVGDYVVELARHPGSFLGHRHPGRRLPLPLRPLLRAPPRPRCVRPGRAGRTPPARRRRRGPG